MILNEEVLRFAVHPTVHNVHLHRVGYRQVDVAHPLLATTDDSAPGGVALLHASVLLTVHGVGCPPGQRHAVVLGGHGEVVQSEVDLLAGQRGNNPGVLQAAAYVLGGDAANVALGFLEHEVMVTTTVIGRERGHWRKRER